MVIATAQGFLAWADAQARSGQPLYSEWMPVTQERIDRFADATGDHYFIHIEPERAARETPFGGTIAHGLLTLSLIPALWEDVRPAMPDVALSMNYGFDKVRFVSPVRCNERVRGCFSVAGVTETKPGAHVVDYRVVVEIEGSDRPAMVANWKVFYALAAASG